MNFLFLLHFFILTLVFCIATFIAIYHSFFIINAILEKKGKFVAFARKSKNYRYCDSLRSNNKRETNTEKKQRTYTKKRKKSQYCDNNQIILGGINIFFIDCTIFGVTQAKFTRKDELKIFHNRSTNSAAFCAIQS